MATDALLPDVLCSTDACLLRLLPPGPLLLSSLSPAQKARRRPLKFFYPFAEAVQSISGWAQPNKGPERRARILYGLPPCLNRSQKLGAVGPRYRPRRPDTYSHASFTQTETIRTETAAPDPPNVSRKKVLPGNRLSSNSGPIGFRKSLVGPAVCAIFG